MDDRERPEGLLDWMGIAESPNWRVSRVLGRLTGALLVLLVPALFLGALLAAVAVLYLTLVDAVQGAPGGPSFGAGALIAALLGAPFVAWATWLRHRALNFQKEGHITDRINKAVEMLEAEKVVKVPGKDADGRDITIEESKPNIEVRLGAILSLERIAQDSTAYDRGRDHVRVMEILCAYVRDNAPASSAKDGPLSGLTGTKSIERKLALHSEVSTWANSLLPPRQDIEVALKVIGGRGAAQRAIERAHRHRNGKPYRPNLSNCNLQKANLEDLDLSGTSFFKSRLEGAFGARAKFIDCNFVDTQLAPVSAPHADFSGSDMKSADLSYALLDGARFGSCDFSFTFFVEAQLRDAIFEFSSGTAGVFLVYCNMEGVLLKGPVGPAAAIVFGKKRHLLAKDHNAVEGVAFRDAVIFSGRPASPSPSISDEDLKLTFGDGSTTISAASRPNHWPTWRLPDSGEHSFDAEWAKWHSDPAAYVPPSPGTDAPRLATSARIGQV